MVLLPLRRPRLPDNSDQTRPYSPSGCAWWRGSVRLRGLEAPVQLQQQDARGGDRHSTRGQTAPAKQEKVEREPGDGPVRKRQETAKKRSGDREATRYSRLAHAAPGATRSPSISGACHNLAISTSPVTGAPPLTGDPHRHRSGRTGGNAILRRRLRLGDPRRL